jgi:O-antigen/teichoic acid export membrane protein
VSEPSAAASAPLPKVLRNASLLVIAQAMGAPVSALVNAVAARSLSTETFGIYYLATTIAAFSVLLVEWGQSAVLTARVAVQRRAAGELLGSALLYRVCAACVVVAAVPALCALLGYDLGFVMVLGLAILVSSFTSIAGAGQDVVRGFERTDFAAACLVGIQLLSAAVVVPTLLAGGGLQGMLIAQASCTAAGALFVLMMMPRLQVPRLSVRLSTVKDLFLAGRPFIVFSMMVMLRPMVDASMLRAFSSPDSMGWFSVAYKLVGVLSYPATALLAALYPTLCRLRAEDPDAFRRTAADAISAVAILVMPVALGCLLFPGLGVAIFGQARYGPAEADLRVLSGQVFLLYFSMPIGVCLLAAGRQTAWTWMQVGSVLISVVCDPFLIRFTQVHFGNGGLGVCIASVASEVLQVGLALLAVPEGVLERVPRRRMVAALLSGGAMVTLALSLSFLEPVVAAALSVLGYFVCLQLVGGVKLADLRSQMRQLRGR